MRKAPAGPWSESVEAFAAAGYQCPQYKSPTDYFLHVASDADALPVVFEVRAQTRYHAQRAGSARYTSRCSIAVALQEWGVAGRPSRAGVQRPCECPHGRCTGGLTATRAVGTCLVFCAKALICLVITIDVERARVLQQTRAVLQAHERRWASMKVGDLVAASEQPRKFLPYGSNGLDCILVEPCKSIGTQLAILDAPPVRSPSCLLRVFSLSLFCAPSLLSVPSLLCACPLVGVLSILHAISAMCPSVSSLVFVLSHLCAFPLARSLVCALSHFCALPLAHSLTCALSHLRALSLAHSLV